MPSLSTRTTAVQKARFLVAASVLILLAHGVDVLHARGPCWPALGIRVAWAALLLANAWFLRGTGSRTFLATSGVTVLGTAALYLALLAQTGWSGSPLFSFTFVLAMVLPVIGSELLLPSLSASAILVLGAGAMLVRDGVPLGEQVGWAHAGAIAFAVAWLLALGDRRARRRIEAERTAREAAMLQLAESERMAAVGRLASEVAHHVNSPLAAARSNAAFLRDGPLDAAEASAAWEDLLASLDRISALARKLRSDQALDGPGSAGGAGAERRSADARDEGEILVSRGQPDGEREA